MKSGKPALAAVAATLLLAATAVHAETVYTGDAVQGKRVISHGDEP